MAAPSPISPNTDVPHTARGQHRPQAGGRPALSPGRCQALGTGSTLRNPSRCAEARCLPMGMEGGQRSFHRHSLTAVGLHGDPRHAETQRFAIPVASGLRCLRGSVLRSPQGIVPSAAPSTPRWGPGPSTGAGQGRPQGPGPTVGSGGALGARGPGVSRCPVPGISCSGGRAGRHSSPEPGAAPPQHTAGPAAMGPAVMGPMGPAVVGPDAVRPMGPAVVDLGWPWPDNPSPDSSPHSLVQPWGREASLPAQGELGASWAGCGDMVLCRAPPNPA